MWNNIKECIQITADEVLGNNNQEMKEKWMTAEILKKMEDRRRIKNQATMSSNNKQKELAREIERDYRKTKEEYYKIKCEELEKLDKLHSPNLYKKLKDLTPKSRKIQ